MKDRVEFAVFVVFETNDLIEGFILLAIRLEEDWEFQLMEHRKYFKGL